MPSRLSRLPPPHPLTAVPLPTTPQPSPDDRSTLGAYPPLWREVITNAKRSYRAYLAGTNGFPNPSEAVGKARECLEDALEVHREEGRTVEAGMSNSHRFSGLFAYRPRTSMQHFPRHGNARKWTSHWLGYRLTQLQVYGEGCNFRSQLKTDIRVQVRNLRSLFPTGFDGRPEEYQARIRKTISAWIADGSYLHGTVAGSVCVFSPLELLPYTYILPG